MCSFANALFSFVLMCVYIFSVTTCGLSQINVHSVSVHEVQIYLGTQRYLM